MRLDTLGPVWCPTLQTHRSDFVRTQEQFHRRGLDCSPWWDDHDLTPVPPDDWAFPVGLWRYQHSLRRLLRSAVDARWESILIVEHDALFTSEADALLDAAVIPDDWETLSLGSYHLWSEPEQIGPHCLRMAGSFGMHALAIRAHLFERILEIPVYGSLDAQIAERIHPRGRSYCVWPAAVVQRSGTSSITGEPGGWPELFGYQSRSDFERKNPTWSG